MENTLENKAKFFGLYLDQEVYCIEGWNRGTMICDAHKIVKEEFKYLKKSFLELKPISSISEEDASNIRGFINKGDFLFYFNKSISVEAFIEGNLSFKDIDFLRSRGYALPFMGLSVDKLIEYGWIKLKEG